VQHAVLVAARNAKIHDNTTKTKRMVSACDTYLRLQIAVQHALLVAARNALQKLEKEAFVGVRLETAVAARIEVFLQVL
jgi:hypothetical protein